MIVVDSVIVRDRRCTEPIPGWLSDAAHRGEVEHLLGNLLAVWTPQGCIPARPGDTIALVQDGADTHLTVVPSISPRGSRAGNTGRPRK